MGLLTPSAEERRLRKEAREYAQTYERRNYALTLAVGLARAGDVGEALLMARQFDDFLAGTEVMHGNAA